MSKKKEPEHPGSPHTPAFWIDLALSALTRCRTFIAGDHWTELAQTIGQASYYLSEAGFQVDKEQLLREHDRAMKVHPHRPKEPPPPSA